MNVFNRIVMVLMIIIGLALLLAIMVQPLTAIDLATSNLQALATSLPDQQFYFVFLVTLGVAEFLLLVLLWAELHRRRRKTVRIKTASGGKAQLGIQSVVQSLEYRIDELAGVRKVQPKVNSRGRDVEVRIDLDTSPSVNVPVLTGQIVDLCHDIVEGQLGVKIKGKVNVNVRHEPYPRGTMPSTGPLGEEAISTPPIDAKVEAVVEPMPAPVSEVSAAPAPPLEMAVGAPEPQQPASVDEPADEGETTTP